MFRLNNVLGRIPVIALGASLAALQACGGGGGGDDGVAVDDTASVNEGQTVVIQVLSNDNNATSAALVSQPQNGDVVLNADNTFSYTHNSSDTAKDSFTYSASNGSGSSNATVTINIDNQPPAPANECLTTRGNLNGTLDVVDPDDDPNQMFFSIDPIDTGSKGTAAITDQTTGQFTYTLKNPAMFGPLDIRRGSDTFTYTVTDGQETTTVTQTVIIDPRIMPLGDSITEGIVIGATLEPEEPFRIGYRAELRQLLASENYVTDFVGRKNLGAGAGIDDDDNEGHGGFEDQHIALGVGQPPVIPDPDEQDYVGVQDALDNNNADVVLLHIGTNATDNNANDVQVILDEIEAWETNNHPVAVLLARIIQKNPMDSTITEFNSAITLLAADRVNNNDLLLVIDQLNALTYPGDLADAGHPTQAGYDKMAQVWFDGLRRVRFFGNLNTPTQDFLAEVMASCP